MVRPNLNGIQFVTVNHHATIYYYVHINTIMNRQVIQNRMRQLVMAQAATVG